MNCCRKGVLASASICIAFISKNWHHVTLASSTYYFLMATLFGSLYSLIALMILILRSHDHHSDLKWRFMAANAIVAIAAMACGIVFTVNIVFLHQSQSSFIYKYLRPSAYIAGMVRLSAFNLLFGKDLSTQFFPSLLSRSWRFWAPFLLRSTDTCGGAWSNFQVFILLSIL